VRSTGVLSGIRHCVKKKEKENGSRELMLTGGSLVTDGRVTQNFRKEKCEK
jgi:hypothetical protein